MITLAPRDAYRLLGANYNSSPNPLLSLDRRTLPGLLPNLSGKLVVDVAAGTGYWAAWCASRGASAMSVDFCWEMLKQAPRPAVLADASQLPLRTACADVAICSFGLGYAPGCFSELARITRPGGFVIASDVHPSAIESGWRRSFRHGDQTIEVGTHPYTLDSLRAEGLVEEVLLEPALGEPVRALFEQAGKPDLFDATCGRSAIFAGRWRRV